ncbi:long-chain-fatty-acid--CoA ligase [Nitratireductor basaltis]|uniref:3-methylmercaptopropionyl-CoA ligase n=1 Tax=Nitratireductor basaltis TaxID=472175 RepID=A0A084UCP0_9HYPH|nr:long-chain-fatty-acid--CoA ligase [Nitratireductor basaltis]KFB10726.1 putative acyl-CoA synthetase [Nitratireductor basaltis]
MQGLMQDWPLLCHKILDHAARQHGEREVVTRTVEGAIARTTYGALASRSRKVASKLVQEGFGKGDRVATLGWNTARHLEVWYGAMGMGGVYHTLNPRLFPDQIAWIMNHAEDACLFVDLTFVQLAEKICPQVKTLRRIVIMTDSANMPETTLDAVAYEDWIADGDEAFAWESFEETTAAGMCYTSGTTGDPKGVVYSHRSNVLHAMMAVQPDAMGLSARDVVLPVVPMFHANAWGLAQSAPMVGAKLVMPGPRLDGEGLYEMLDSERVTFTAAVPTVWLMLLQYLEKTGKKLPHLRRVVIGGSACPRSMTQKFQDIYDVEVIHAWGMTEMSPLGSLCSLKPEYEDLEGEARLDIQDKQGHAPFGVEMRIVNDNGEELPWDGKTFGRLQVRGPAVSSSYYGGAGAEQFDEEGWFDTGDVAHIDRYGYLKITDRAKDVIKSGGEWISTIELENLAVGHPEVAEAAVIGVHHPKWDERPLLVVVKKEGCDPTREDLITFLSDKVAKWWLPDDVVFVDELPHTATGKIQKTTLRRQMEGYTLPQAV